MDWYSLVKFLHVVAAVIWVGGGFAIMLMGARADRASDAEGTMAAMRATGELGTRVMVPASLVTLLTGLTMCWFWIGFSDLWVVIGLAGFTTTFLIGMLIFKPTGDRISALIAEEGLSPAALAEGRRVLKVARFDYTVMFVIVAAMVLKPTSADVAVLTGMSVVLLAGAAAAFGSWGDGDAAEAEA